MSAYNCCGAYDDKDHDPDCIVLTLQKSEARCVNHIGKLIEALREVQSTAAKVLKEVELDKSSNR